MNPELTPTERQMKISLPAQLALATMASPLLFALEFGISIAFQNTNGEQRINPDWLPWYRFADLTTPSGALAPDFMSTTAIDLAFYWVVLFLGLKVFARLRDGKKENAR
jgi:hypothetical protein